MPVLMRIGRPHPFPFGSPPATESMPTRYLPQLFATGLPDSVILKVMSVRPFVTSTDAMSRWGKSLVVGGWPWNCSRVASVYTSADAVPATNEPKPMATAVAQIRTDFITPPEGKTEVSRSAHDAGACPRT